MGEIIESKRRHYVGDDADKDSIPAAAKAFGDSYHANDKGKQYYWNGTAWKTGLGYEYVPRRVAAADFAVGAFTTDGTWKIDGLDLSGIVPAGAIAVLLSINLADDAAGNFFIVRANATDTGNDLGQTTQVANIGIRTPAVVAIDSNRLLDYIGSNVAFTTIDIWVTGWYI